MNIKQLRQTILDRAIRGQLVSQDPTDEPASVLLERIRAEKEELIKEKKLKREKRESQPIEEVTFEIPEGWVWCRLGEIGIWGSGVTPSRNKKEYYDGNIPWLKTGDLNDSYIYETSELITDLAVKDCSLKKIPIGSVLIAMYGATIAKLGLLEIEVTINQACCACTPFSGIVNKFLFYYLFSQKQNIKDKAEGGAQPNISKEKLINFPFPLPPLKEQHRIVQKIEQLFALVDIIEVNKKALEKLIERAKSQVLNDAVAGKLTHQDPNDEPAEELLKRIGKTTAPDTPYEKMLPKGWACTEMQVLCQLLDGKKKEGVLYPYLDVVFLRGKTEGSYKENGKYIPKNTHLILVDGENSGEIFTTTIEGYQGSTLKILNISQEVNEQFIFYILRKEQKLFKESKTGSAIPHLNKKIFKELIVFLPPLAEQCRIVKKIETYFAAFDKIKYELI
jgi:type I restriction-modification system